MELYTLTSAFLPREIIENFTSVIWTERYFGAGDMQLVVPALPSTIQKFAPGTFVGLQGTKEIMIVETQSIENQLLTVTGSALTKFLDERQAWFKNVDPSETTLAGEYTETTTAGELISSAVYRTVIAPIPFSGAANAINLDWTRDKIANLYLGVVDANGTPKRLSVSLGTLYDSIQKLAVAEGVGFKLYLASSSYSGGYVLKFVTYRGRNRTSEQEVNPLVRFTPKMDSLSDVKEVISSSNYKNVIYVNYKNQMSVHYIQPDLPIPTEFNRRVLVVEAPDLYFEPGHVAEFREQVARNAIVNHIYIQAVDGKVSSQIGYKYGVHYHLGDVIELEGYSGLLSKARVTEYIRSQDSFGEQEYPTLSVIDPLETGYMPDLEPNPDPPPDDDGPDDDTWDNDGPTFTGDIDTDALPPVPPDDGPSDSDELPNPDDPVKDPKIKHPKDPNDPNPDPVPNFGDVPPGGGGNGDGNSVPVGAYLVTGYYPNQDGAEQVAYIQFDDGTILPGWVYGPFVDDPSNVDPDDLWALELIPQGWTIANDWYIVRSEENKESSDEYPWTRGYAFWLRNPEVGFEHVTLGDSPPNGLIKLTDTIPTNRRDPGEAPGSTHGWDEPGIIWCGSTDDWAWYMATYYPTPQEYVYADGTYSTDGTLTGHGKIVAPTTGGAIELHRSTGGSGGRATISGMTKILGAEDFPANMRWSRFEGPLPSPDGNKLLIGRQNSSPASSWQLQAMGAVVGGTFTISVGLFGSAAPAATTLPIAYNATADQIYDRMSTLPYLDDPRLVSDYPYVPYYMGGLLENGSQMQFQFVTPESGVWLQCNTGALEPGPLGSVYSIYDNGFWERGQTFWYLCDADGSNLQLLDVDIIPNTQWTWSPDSTMVHAVVPSAAGDFYCRWINYDIATGAISYPLDYSGAPLDSNGYGQLKDAPRISPDNQKIVFISYQNEGDPKQLMIADVDGSNLTQIYEDPETPDQDNLVLSYGNQMAWSFDSQKLAVIDARDESPIWYFNLGPNTMTKVYPGTGWENSDAQIWLYNPLKFDG